MLAAGYDPGDRESNAFYRERILPLEYDSLLDVAGANLRIGRPVVIDAPFSPYLSDPTSSPRPRSASTGRPVDVEVVLRPRLPHDTATSATETRPRARPRSSSPTGTSTGPSTEGDPAPGQAFVYQNSPTTHMKLKPPPDHTG